MTLVQNLILFTKLYGNLQETLEMASFLRYVDLYLTNGWGRFYVGHSIEDQKQRENCGERSERHFISGGGGATYS
jgi:hypothetical protein